MAPPQVIILLSRLIGNLLNVKIPFIDVQEQLFLMEAGMEPTNPVLAQYIKLFLKEAKEYRDANLWPKDIFSSLKP